MGEARNMDTSHSNCSEEANLLKDSKWDPEFGEISESLSLESIDEEICKLLDLPDDVLLLIVRRLNHFDLLSLSETCKRLNQLCLKTQSLWIDVDFSDHPLELQLMPEIIENFHDKTRSLVLEGFLSPKIPLFKTPCNITGPLMAGIASSCSNLKRLELHKVRFNNKVEFKHFPSTLNHLSLVSCDLELAHLEYINNYLPNLEFVSLQDTRGVNGDYIHLSWFGQLPKLKEFGLNGAKVVDNSVDHCPEPDLGFPSLEKLDLRRTEIGFCELRIVAELKSPLKELLLGSDLDGCSFYFINSSHSNAGNGIERTLERLTLDGCKIDRKSLLNIGRQCAKLQKVYLNNCIGISGATVRDLTLALQKRNPESEVIYE